MVGHGGHGGGRAARSEPTAVVSVHGADHPGIVAAVTRVLADAGVNVCDLQTRLARDLYVMIMDVAVPPGLASRTSTAAYRPSRRSRASTITVRPVDADVLDPRGPPPPRTRCSPGSPRPRAGDPAPVVEDLLDTMRSFGHCVGIAAPQIGERRAGRGGRRAGHRNPAPSTRASSCSSTP